MIWSFIILSYVSLFALGFADNLRGPLFPQILSHFHLNDTEGSWIFVVSSVMSFLGSLGAGVLLKTFRKITVLAASLFILFLALLGMMLSSHYFLFLVFSGFLGLSMGAMGVAQNTLVTLGVPQAYRSQVLSGLHAVYGLASMAATLFVSLWMTTKAPWAGIFGAGAVIPLMGFLGAVFWKTPSEPSLMLVGKRINLEEKGQLWGACILAFYVVAEIMVSSRLALFMTRYESASPEKAGMFVTYFFILLLLGRLFLAFYKLPFKTTSQLVLALAGSILALFWGLFINPWGFVISGLTMAPVYPLAVTYIAEAFPRSLESAIAKAMAAQSLWVVGMHYGVGALSDYWGLKKALYLGPTFLFLSLGILLYFEKQRGRRS